MKQFLKENKRTLIFYNFMCSILAFLMIADSFLIQYIIDFSEQNSNVFYAKVVIVVASVLILQAIFYYIQQKMADTFSKEISNNLRIKIFSKLNDLDIDTVLENQSSHYLAKLTSKLDIIENQYSKVLLWANYLCYQFIIAVIASFMINWMLAMIALILSVPMVFLPTVFSKKITNMKQNVLGEIENTNSTMADFLAGTKDWKGLDEGNVILEKTIQSSEKLLEVEFKDIEIQTRVATINKVFSDILYFGIWLAGGYFIFMGSFDVSKLVAFTQLVSSISFPLHSVSDLITQAIGGNTAVQEIEAFLALENNNTNLSKSFTSIKSFNYKDVSLVLDDTKILNNISLHFDTTKKYVVIGESGSGKSTIFSLLQGIYKNFTGSITLDNDDYHSFSDQSIFKYFGFLSQNSHIFNTSILENVRLFNQNYAKETVSKALVQAGLGDWENQRDLDQVIHSDWPGVSGGEKQRILLARLLLRNKQFYILDEFASGLDPKNSESIENDLLGIDAGFVYITHRLNKTLFSQVDEIIVVESGRIVCSGNYIDANVQEYLRKLSMTK